MSNFERVVSRILEDKEAEGVNKGKNQGIMQVAKEMVKNKMKDEDILKVTHLSRKELEELKKLEFQTV